MRPIHLKFAGLQSYREAQEIDFTGLCDAGVFGIFGPTGSGKSTILDAITLALYGKVERASGGTQGIMNHAEGALSASFTFELGGAAGRELYRVERQFKRGSELSVNNTLSRLVRLEPGPEQVLADKAGEVNAAVQELLGLTMQDFTRAVVLPQGKFAEFLTLKGSERRQMLQRLFHLEQYGDELNARLGRRVKETQAAIQRLAAEQQGLGDASESAVQAAGERLEATGKQLEASRQALAGLDSRGAELQQVWTLQTERRKLAEARDGHAESAGRMEELAARIGLAEQAEALLPVLAEWEAADRQLAEAEHTYGSAAKSRETAEAAHTAAKAEREAAVRNLAEREPALIAEGSRLKQALEAEASARQIKDALAGVSRQWDEAVRERSREQEQWQKEQDTLAKALSRQKELKELLQQCAVSPEWRGTIQAACGELRHAGSLEQQLQETESSLKDKLRALAETDARIGALAEGAEASASRAVQLMQELSALWTAWASASSGLESLRQSLPAAASRLQKRLYEAERASHAAWLAERLESGSPCPVCGSCDHPVPVRPGAGEDAGDCREALAGLEEISRDAQEALLACRQLEYRLHALREQAEDWSSAEGGGPGDLVAEAAAAWASAPEKPGAGALDPTEWMMEPAEARTRLAELSESAGRLDRELKKVEMQWAETKREREKAKGEWAVQLERRQTLLGVAGEEKQKSKRLSEQLRDIREGWSVRFPGCSMEQAEPEAEAIREKDSRAADFTRRLETSETFIAELQSRMEERQRRIAALDKKGAQLETRHQELDRQQSALREQISQWTGGRSEPVQALLDQAEGQLKRLKEAGRLAEERLERTAGDLRLSGEALAAAAESRAAAARRLEHGRQAWAKASAGTPFGSPDRLREASAAAGELEQWRNTLRAYKEEEARLDAKLQHVDGQLSGRQLSEEEWADFRRDWETARQAAEQAVRERARAERDREDVMLRHSKWVVLEADKCRQEELSARLNKLQSVFRGNAFVEFIAEEQLNQVSRSASERLGELTRRRYALETDSGGGFVIRDDAGGGMKRPVASLSGGETFLTSLSLALALSAQIQLKGKFPLQFFFLDEGFGTLDPELLDTVITALERLHTDRLAVGVISHVPELRARLHRKLVILPAEPSGRGSVISSESS